MTTNHNIPTTHEQEVPENLKTDGVYFVATSASSAPESDESALVAIDPVVRANRIEWYDTVQERRLNYDSLRQLEDGSLLFHSADNNLTYQLTPLDLELYNQYVRPKLRSGPLFKSVEELWAALREAKGD